MNPTSKTLHSVLGTGPLARATAEALIARGLAVRLINTSGRMADAPAGASIVAANLLDPAAAQAALAGASVVHFCAQPPYHLWVEQFPALQSAVVAATRRIGAILIVAENLYGYGPSQTPFREDMPLAPNTRKGAVRSEMHQTLMAEHAKGNLAVAVARAADFFGPHVEGSAMGGRAMRAIAAGKPVEVMGNPDMAHAYTFIGDFGTAMATLGVDGRSLGQVWHVPNAPAVSTRQFVEVAFRAAGRASRGVRRMSRIELRLIGLFVPPVRESIEMLYEFEAPFLVDDTKYIAVFGNHATPLEAALARTLTMPGASRQAAA